MVAVAAVARAAAPAEVRAPVTDSPELAQAELRLSDWVHGPSGKTPDGKAKIADLLEQVDTIKASIRKANDAGALSRPPLQAGAAPLGPVTRGSLLNLQA